MRPCDVTVLIGTFGGPAWQKRAEQAAKSAIQLGCDVSWVHGDTLAQARMAALENTVTPWVVHLDADDRLTRGYFEGTNEADVQPTRIKYIKGTRPISHPAYPRVAGHTHECEPDCLYEGNFIHVGAILRTELAKLLTWQEWPVYEDYCYWVQALKLGASFEKAPGIYEAWVRLDSRNRGTSRQVRRKTHFDIATYHFPEKDWSYLLS